MSHSKSFSYLRFSFISNHQISGLLKCVKFGALGPIAATSVVVFGVLHNSSCEARSQAMAPRENAAQRTVLWKRIITPRG